MAAIELLGVTKHWADSTALHHISARIPAGSFCVLLGPSGCGKSTTLRILAGLETASSGQVLIDGRDVTALPPALCGVAMVFQNYALFPHLSVADNIDFGLQVRKTPPAEARQRVQQAAELLGMMSNQLESRSASQRGAQVLGLFELQQQQASLMTDPPVGGNTGTPFQAKPHTASAILCGDFNIAPSEPAYDSLLNATDDAGQPVLVTFAL